MDDAAYVPQWLDGLIFLPLLCLVGEWTVRRRRWVPGVLIFAAAWYLNFYSAYMATIGAVAIVLARVLSMEMSWRARLEFGIRYTAAATCGVALVMPLFVPTFLAVSNAPKTDGFAFDVSPLVLLARLLPATEDVGNSPGIYVGTLVLLAVAAFPFDRTVPRRTRVVWTSLPLLLALSFERPGQYVWNGFDPPDGSPFRGAFTLCAALVIVGWIGVTEGRPGRRPLLFAAGFQAVLILVALVSPLTSRHAVALLVAGAVAAAATVRAARRAERRPGDRGARTALVAAAAALTAVVAVEQTVTAVVVDQRRSLRFGTSPAWNAAHERRAKAIRSADAFPRYRTVSGRPGFTANDPLLLGAQGAAYYSSVLPLGTSRTLIALGFPYDLRSTQGRHVLDADSPVLDAIFAVGARATAGGEPVRWATPPLVTLRPAARTPAPGTDPFRVQEAVLGSAVYRFPEVRWSPAGGAPPLASSRGTPQIPADDDRRARYEAVVTCAPGSSVAGWTPRSSENLRESASPGMVTFGTVPRGGTLKIATTAGAEAAPVPVVGCVDPALLHAAVQRLRADGARWVRVSGHGIEAGIPAGRPGVAVVSVPRVDGWRCASGDGPARRPGSHGGLIAVPIDGSATRISCRYTPPGLPAGTALGLLGLLGMLCGAYLGQRRRRRQEDADGSAAPEAVLTVSGRPTPDKPRS
ncbi:YfhO family protein [Actinomadura madurae]|uniref:YfhO family protein n=1 Tax=Actinomadura madurae TaxID=1993 RepID=UPI0024E1B8A8|nr:YfhO family protein [Actinomadura madurae]